MKGEGQGSAHLHNTNDRFYLEWVEAGTTPSSAHEHQLALVLRVVGHAHRMLDFELESASCAFTSEFSLQPIDFEQLLEFKLSTCVLQVGGERFRIPGYHKNYVILHNKFSTFLTQNE